MRRPPALVCLLMIASGHSMASPPHARNALLDALGSQLITIRASVRVADPSIPRPGLTPLIGARRSDISASLGAPDFCGGAPADKCIDVRKWEFFYFKAPPRISNHGATAAIEVTGGGGWSLVLGFDAGGVVNKAQWVRQQ